MTKPTLGIDIAKLKFNVCLINKSGTLRHKVFPNTATGFEQLREWLAKHGIECVHACMEATGTYGESLALFLYQAVNRRSEPRQPITHSTRRLDSILFIVDLFFPR